MPWNRIEYQKPKPWNDVIGDLEQNPFIAFSLELSNLNIEQDEAMEYFIFDYNSARTIYDKNSIYKIFEQVQKTHKKKYEKLISIYRAEYDPIANYDMIEVNGNARKISDSKITNMDHGELITTSTIPTMKNSNFTTTYESAAENRLREYTISEPYGSNAAESGTNLPITRTAVSQSADAEGKKGNETINSYTNDVSIMIPFDSPQNMTGNIVDSHKLTRKGNIGVTTTQQMIEAEMQLSAKMNIFKIIEKDIAKTLFLNVW